MVSHVYVVFVLLDVFDIDEHPQILHSPRAYMYGHLFVPISVGLIQSFSNGEQAHHHLYSIRKRSVRIWGSVVFNLVCCSLPRYSF